MVRATIVILISFLTFQVLARAVENTTSKMYVPVIGELKESVLGTFHKRLLIFVDTLVKCLKINPRAYSFMALSFVDLSWNSGYEIDPGHTAARDSTLIRTQIALSKS